MLLAFSVFAFILALVAITYWLAFQRRYGVALRRRRRTRSWLNDSEKGSECSSFQMHWLL